VKKLTLASRFKLGFTIVELLIVVSVLAVVATIALATFNTIQRSAVNMLVERTAAEAQRTLQTHFIANRYYPANIASTDYKPPLDAPVVLYTNAAKCQNIMILTMSRMPNCF
jgi:prepilin-type N-terminal cleavage/methylation domain-containing protein